MKKLVAFSCALLMLCGVTACGVDSTSTADTQSSVADSVASAETTKAPEESSEAPAESAGDSSEAPAVTDESPAKTLLADFKARMASGDTYTAESMATALIGNSIIQFMGAAMPVEEGFLNGFTEEIKGFSDACFFGPMIGSIPFAGYVFTLADGADVAAFTANLKEKADLRWNVCVEADEMVCEAVDNTVFFLMAPAKFEEEPIDDMSGDLGGDMIPVE